MLGITVKKKQGSWIRELRKGEDIQTRFLNKKWTWAHHMCRYDNRWTTKVTSDKTAVKVRTDRVPDGTVWRSLA